MQRVGRDVWCGCKYDKQDKVRKRCGMNDFITYMGSAIIGWLLSSMGYGLWTWQFWLILFAYVGSNVSWMIKCHFIEKGGK